ncbi:MAG TPA: DUF3800 domain-containing protein [Sphingomonas sp.]|nr:DUF3800 domain-containing protein [Sphingomonas sp.]
MVSLHAFIDDSASDIGDRRLFLAAYVNGAGPWIAFGHDWRMTLAAPPAIGYLKMSEAQNLSGQFRRWSAADRDTKILKLAQVIVAHRPWSIHCSVSRADYARIVAPVAPYPLKQPYFSCFWGIIRTAADYHLQLDRDRRADTYPVPPLDYVFDEQGGLGTDAALWYTWLKETQEPEVAALMGDQPIFGDDKKIVALQAADMLAWHLRRRHERGADERLPILDLLTEHGAYREIDRTALERWAEEFRHVPGVARVQTKAAWRETREATRAAVAAGVNSPNTSLAALRWGWFKVRIKELMRRRRRGRKR